MIITFTSTKSSNFTFRFYSCYFRLLAMLTALFTFNHRLSVLYNVVRSAHIWHKVLSADTELVAVALIVRCLVITVTKLLNQMSSVYLNVVQLLILCSNKHINLVSSKTNDFVHRKNYFVNVKLFNNFVCQPL